MLRHLSISTLLCLSLGACSTLTDVPVGTPLSEIQQQFGPANVACPTNNPTRFIWTSQPFGQFAWAVDTDKNQRLISSRQVLTDAEFDLLRQGQWSKERVWCHFGPPAEQDITPYKGVKMQVWTYRYKQNSAWDSLMHVYFNKNEIVQHHHPAPDLLKTEQWEAFRPF